MPSPDPKIRQVSKSKSIQNEPPTTFNEFQGSYNSFRFKNQSILEPIDEHIEQEPRISSKVPSFMNSNQSDQDNRLSMPISDQPSINVSNLDKSDGMNETEVS